MNLNEVEMPTIEMGSAIYLDYGENLTETDEVTNPDTQA